MTEAENPQFRKFGRVLDGAAAQEERMEKMSADSKHLDLTGEGGSLLV